LKSKIDFYIAFYEQLALQGFRAYKSSYDYDNKYLADICFKGYNIAHLTKTDHIVPNPHAEIPLGAMEHLKYIALETAQKFAACTEPPYDERVCEQTPDGSYILAQCGNMVLACASHHLFGYVFYTLEQPDENSEPHDYQTFFAQSDAARDFAVKSGLIDRQELFTESELAAIHNNLIRVLIMPNNDLDVEAVREIDAIITKTQHLVPDFGADDISSDLESEAELEGVEP
jgi:hypothetical protein